MNVTIIGGGYVGLVTGACLSTLGHNITIVEIFPEKVEAINNAVPPIYEEGLEDILKSHVGQNLTASTTYESVQTADAVFIAVGTPPNPDGSANLTYIKQAAENIADELAKAHSEYPVVVVKSTVPPGTTRDVVCKTIREKLPDLKFGCCMNPEFLREGRAVFDFMNPDRIVIGTANARAAEIMHNLYAGIDAPILDVEPTAAEMIKYTSNALLAAKISFANEIGNLCKKIGVDVYEVMKGVGMDSRVSPKFLNAGAGFGGSCFPKDVSALADIIRKENLEPVFLDAVLKVNDLQPLRMISLLEEKIGELSGKRIAVLGLAFKDNTDDIRESRSIPVIEKLLAVSAKPVCYDPMASDAMQKLLPDAEYVDSAAAALTDADGCLVMTEWPEFTKLNDEFNLMKTRAVIDGRHILSIPDAEGICW
ncbi:MAG: UDP-glucose/GDP-mannose dehydrogenase family protein [Methanocorpusculum sp.]|jgi:UDPglucose 6-dehydrogenase|nr:UDP-glucose/GDP-mannose dehydrogenase family protein [Methanocorpusculum sp.]